ncbi:MAG: conjugal transfer protein TraG N-terminal domain-containing protein [Candidatus Paracaedibacteraceae bacterium]|nr:conjugal transfer protein TraG N-terminal domain-containing protein [Candidatus Paracaedibacteraceae bacterium]
MDLAVYTFGGGEILWKIFNGIAILFKTENKYFSSLGGVTATFAAFWIGAQAIAKGQPFDLFKKMYLPFLFLTTLFFGITTTVHLIDEVDANQKYSRIDNVPFGIAVIASLTSSVSKHITQSIEPIFTSPTSTAKYSTTGLMFGARLASMARNVVIKDPVSRENLRDFVSRCFMWPYVFTNIRPGKKAALETEDILGFIDQNAHPTLGMYWKDQIGTSTFVTCKECIAKVRGLMDIEKERNLSSFASKIFNRTDNGDKAKQKLLSYFGDGWQKLTSKTATAADIIQQSLLINAYREALDSERDEKGLGRIDPDLIRMNATRSKAQQNAGWLVSAANAGEGIPTLHMTLFGLALMLAAIIAPLTLLPNGLKLILNWMKIMTWLATWPIFYAILDGLGEIMAARAVASNLIGIDTNLTIATQNLLSDSAFDAYCWIQSLQIGVPFFSWALISGGGYAMSQMAASSTRGIEASASKAAAEMVDGNTTFDSQTLNYRSIANAQIAQQQLGSSLSYGARVDDGQLTTITASNGNEIFQETQTQLGSNVNTNSMMSQIAGINVSMNEQAAFQQSQAALQSSQQGFNKIYSVMDSVSKNNTLADTFGTTESAQAQNSLNQANDIVTNFARDNQISADRATAIGLQAGLNAGISSNSGMGQKILGSLGASVGGNLNSNFTARENELIKKFEQSGLTRSFAENFNAGMQYMEDHKGSISNSSLVQSMDQAQANFSQSISYNDQATNSLNTSRMWSKTAAFSEQNSIGSSGNINRDVLSYVADRKFGGDTIAAAQWQTGHQQEYLQMAGDYMKHRQSNLSTGGSLSLHRREPQQFYEEHRLENPVTTSDYESLKKNTNIGVTAEAINEGLAETRDSSSGHMNTINQKMGASEFEEAQRKLSGQHERARKKSTVKLAKRKAVRGNVVDSID